jgi:hypothetical protein
LIGQKRSPRKLVCPRVWQNKKPPLGQGTKGRFVAMGAVTPVTQEREQPRALDGDGELALMACAGAGDAAGNNLSAVGEISSQAGDVLVIDIMNLVDTERADLFSAFSAARLAVRLSFLSKANEMQLLFPTMLQKRFFRRGDRRRCRAPQNRRGSRWRLTRRWLRVPKRRCRRRGNG